MNVNDPSGQDQARGLADLVVRGSESNLAEWQAAVDRLTALALSSNPEIAATASRTLFRDVVEVLADSFDPALSDLYVEFFSRVIAAARRDHGLSAVDQLLKSFGLTTDEDTLRRGDRVRRPAHFNAGAFDLAGRGAVRKVLVPSRVTLGADIAVTSVVLRKMKDVFPQAELVLLGGAKTGAFFASDSRVRLSEIVYSRGGTLRDRLSAWPALVDLVRREIDGLEPEEYIVVDPDSRLTQLGLLPLVPDEGRYRVFESRSFTSPGSTSISELTGKWLDGIFGAGSSPSLPYVSLSEEDSQRGAALKAAAAGRPLVAVNLGVGDNSSKRVVDPFESELLSLLYARGYAIVLDQGAGEEELARTSRLIQEIQDAGATVSRVGDAPNAVADVNVWQGSLNGFAGCITFANLYVGYDSAGGHLAAALGVPGIDIFAGASSPRMLERWTPWGTAAASVIVVESGPTCANVISAVRERLP